MVGEGEEFQNDWRERGKGRGLVKGLERRNELGQVSSRSIPVNFEGNPKDSEFYSRS